MRRAARNLAISSKKSLWELKKNDSRGANSSTGRPASIPYCTYSTPSRSVKASSWSAVEPASRMWYPEIEIVFQLRNVLRAEGELVRDQPHRGARREDVLLLGDVFLQDVVLERAADPLPRRAVLLGDREVHRQRDRRRRVDRHRRRHAAEVDAVEEHLHVPERIDRDAALADLASAPSRGPSRSRRASAGGTRSRGPSARDRGGSENAALVCFAVPNPANWRIVQSFPRYPVGWTPRVNGYSPGQPRSRSKSNPGWLSGPASGSVGAPETVVQSFFQEAVPGERLFGRLVPAFPSRGDPRRDQRILFAHGGNDTPSPRTG